MEADFSGYATKHGLKCSDGRTIMHGAFKDDDGQKVPLVWQHRHNEPANVLGHAILEERADGTYAYGFFNDTAEGQKAKALVVHGDITALSIWANQLVQRGSNVIHGAIREVSLVLAGANPGAFIDNINFAHSDGEEDIDDEAIIYTGLSFSHEDASAEVVHADGDTDTINVKQIFDTLNDEQKELFYYVAAEAAGDGAEDLVEDGEVEHSDDNSDSIQHDNQEGTTMGNLFEDGQQAIAQKPHLTHAQLKAIFEDAPKYGGSLKESFFAHAAEYGIENIEVLFPDAKTVTPTPELVGRDTSWVSGVLSGTKHSPFSRVKSTSYDLTEDEARAKGYIKGSLKKEEVFSMMKRTTGPAMVYKKQKLDRQDIIDVTDLDVVAFLKAEMRLMLNEEIARAILVGDGRSAADPDKIKDPAGAPSGDGIRSILHDDPFYTVPLEVGTSIGDELIEKVVRGRKKLKGSGVPTFYTTNEYLIEMLLAKDGDNRRLYNSKAEVATALNVKEIVEVEVLEEDEYSNLVGILVNLTDYTIGADKGGEITLFDDFDIDYNQYKYLIETYISGGLTKPFSAMAVLVDATPTP